MQRHNCKIVYYIYTHFKKIVYGTYISAAIFIWTVIDNKDAKNVILQVIEAWQSLGPVPSIRSCA